MLRNCLKWQNMILEPSKHLLTSITYYFLRVSYEFGNLRNIKNDSYCLSLHSAKSIKFSND